MAVTLGSKNVGDVVKINENGVLTNFIVIHKGRPSATYDASCDGVWVLRERLYGQMQWDTGATNDYAASSIKAWMENTYYQLIDAATKSVVKNVKIPYSYAAGYSQGSTVVNKTGQDGVACHCFLLSPKEVLGGIDSFPIGSSLSCYDIGTPLSYFTERGKAIAYNSDGKSAQWWTRHAYGTPGFYNPVCLSNGKEGGATITSMLYVRPAMILDYNAVVNDNGCVTTNTAPSTPGTISVPGSIRGGSTITVSWTASSDAQGNLEGYKLERSTNGGAWTQIYQGGGTSTANNVAYGTNTVMYRVKAYDSMGAESGYRTSNNVAVINNTAPGAPQGITVPVYVRGGGQLTISWGPSADAENNLAGYELERSVNGGTWTQIYRNTQQSYTDSITFGWNTVAYRVRAYDAYSAYSGYATSEARAVDNNRPPQITSEFASGSDLGVKNEGFSVTYTVTDPDNNTGDVAVTESLDGIKKKEFHPVLGAVNTIATEGIEFQCLPNGQHNISISASDGKLACTHALKFTKSVTSAMITLETPLEADDQITACAIAVSGYIPQDANFRVLVTNNANDAEPKWENCTQLVKDGANYVFSNQNAANGYAFNFKITVSRGESGEGGYITSVQGGFQ